MLLERQEILDRLHGLVSASRRGSGRLVLLTGEAGIGKTSVVSALAADLPPDTALFWGSCDAVTPARAFAPLFDIAHRAPPDLSAALARSDRDCVLNAFLRLIRSGPGRSRCVVVEDIHWADAATLDLLRVVGPRLSQAHAVVIATFRDAEVEPLHPLRVALGELPAGAVTAISVPPLSAEAVAQIARPSLFDGDALYRVTRGNPFFVTEVVAAFGRGVPATVRDAVLARAARLSPEANRTLVATAVLGPRAERDLVQSLAGGGTSAVDECVRAGMLERDGDALHYRHELARDAVLETVPTDDLRDLNRRAVSLLRQVNEIDAGRVARHAMAAGDRVTIVEFAPEAARRAAGLGAHREAIQYLESALERPIGLATSDRARLLEAYAGSLTVLGKPDEAAGQQRRALALWEEAEDPIGQSGSLVGLSFITWLTGDGVGATTAARQAVALLDHVVPESAAHARASAALAQRLFVSGADDELALWHSARALRIAEAANDEETAVHALTTLGALRLYLGNDRGWQDLESAVDRAQRAGLTEDAFRAKLNLIEAAMDLLRLDDADRYAAAAADWLADRDLDLYRDLLSGRLSELALRRGRWNEAERLSTELVSRPRTASQVRARALTVLGRIAALRATRDPWPLLDEARSLVGPGEPQDLRPLLTARIEAAWLADDTGRMDVETAAAAGLATAQQPEWAPSELAFWLWRAGALADIPPTAAQPFLAHMSGQFGPAADGWATLGCPLYRAHALIDLGTTPALRDALAIVQRLGAKSLATRISQRLRATGATELPRGPRPSTRGNPFGLTDRETEILALLSDGLRNAEIAERLVVSPKTVDHHVGAVLRKLGVADRDSAAQVARDMRTQNREPRRPT